MKLDEAKAIILLYQRGYLADPLLPKVKEAFGVLKTEWEAERAAILAQIKAVQAARDIIKNL